MKNLTSSDLQAYQLLETPPIFLGKLLRSSSPIYEQQIRNSSILPAITRNKVIYLPDFLHSFPEGIGNWEKSILCDNINKIRHAIACTIDIKSPDFLDLSFTKKHIEKDDLPKLNWIPIGNNTNLIYKLSRVRRSFQGNFPDFQHDNLAPEAIRKISAQQVLTITTFQPNLRTLRDHFFSISSSEKIAAIIQALKGNLYLDKLGLAHGDIKQDNIYIYPTADNSINAKLGDLEGCVPLNADLLPGMVTNCYYEYSYYPDDKYTIDQNTDLFSWGTLLVEIFTDFNIRDEFQRFEQKKSKGLSESNDDIYKKLCHKISKKWRPQYPQSLLPIITRLLTPRKPEIAAGCNNFRGTLNQLIDELTVIQSQLCQAEKKNQGPNNQFKGILNLTKAPPSS